MKLTTWNIRGLGSKRKQRNLSNRIKEEKLDMVFIQETKCSMDKIREINIKWLRRYEYLEVKADISTRGILTLWDPQKLGILNVEASRNYLSLVIQPVGDKEIYIITNVYRPQKLEDKLKLLTSLDGGGSRIHHPHGQIFGNKNMHKIGRRGIIFECLGLLRDPTFGILLRKIEALSSSTASGRSEMGTWKDSRRITGSKNQTYLEKN